MLAMQAGLQRQPPRQSDRHLTESSNSALIAPGPISPDRARQRVLVEWSCEVLGIPKALARIKRAAIPGERCIRIGGPEPQLLHEHFLLKEPLHPHSIVVVGRH